MKLKSKVSAIFVAVAVGLLAFQNCSVTHFAKDYSSVTMSSAIVDAKGAYYTNSRTLPVVLEVSSLDFSEARASIFEDMDANAVEWVQLNGELRKSFIIDLGDQFAADGSKDGEKTVFVESRDPITKKILKSKIAAYLDTQTPVMSRKGILESGIQGKSFEMGQLAKLEWGAEDKVSLSGFESGIDPDSGFRWGTANSSDCSESSLVTKSDWGASKSEMQVEWPSADPLSAFYFCLYVKDRAGNTANLMSQPMTSLWNVVAGDNSQGNGSSVTSNKVRFKLLKNMFVDNDKNIQLTDSAFGVTRVIKSFENDPSRTIEQSQFNKNFSVELQSPAVTDSEGNYYFVNGYYVYMVPPDRSKATKIIKSDVLEVKLAIRKYEGADRLLVARSVMFTPNDVAAKNFLMEVPVAKIKELTTPMAIDDAIAQYRIAGNGIVPPSTYVIPASVKLTKADPADNEHSLGYIANLVAGENGDIYVFTGSNSDLKWGILSCRRLRPNADGSFQQTVLFLGSDAYAPYQVAYKKAGGGPNPHELLFVAQPHGAVVINLSDNSRSRPFPELTPGFGSGILLVPILGGKDYEIYIASANRSKLFRYDSSYKLIEGLGRDISDVDVNNALASVLGNPDGLIQDPDGNIYVADSQNGVLQKVLPDGKMELMLGTYSANTSFLNGYTFRLAGDFDKARNRNVIYSSRNFQSSQLYVHDLNAKTSKLLYPLTTPQSDPNSKYDWTLSSLALIKNADDKNVMLMSRGYYQVVTKPWHTGYTSFIGSMNINGTEADIASRSVFAGDLLKGRNEISLAQPGIFNNSEVYFQTATAAKIVVDSAKNIFSSSNFLMFSRLDQTVSRNINFKIGGAFAVIEDPSAPNLRHIIFQRNSVLAALLIDLSKINDPLIDPQVKVNNRLINNLCLPGSAIRGVRDIINDNEGNLLISDSSNARVLKYRIRDSNGNLKLNYCN